MRVEFQTKETIHIDDLDSILSRYSDFKRIKREIKLESIFDKKIQLDIDIIFDKNLIGYYDEPELSKSSFKIKSLSIIIKSMSILGISGEIETINTEMGKILKQLIDINPTMLEFFLINKNFFFSVKN